MLKLLKRLIIFGVLLSLAGGGLLAWLAESLPVSTEVPAPAGGPVSLTLHDEPTATREYLQSQLTDIEREIFMVIFVDNRNRVLKHSCLFAGTLSHVEVHPREIVREAIKVNAAGVILAHNHPSGCAEPSRADKEITERIIKCCQFMDIRVLDHLIIGRGEYISFAEHGWI